MSAWLPSVADYADFLPASWHDRVDREPTSTWWNWQRHEVHVLRRVNPDAPVRVLLVHGAGGHSAALWPIAVPTELVMLRECGHFPIEDPGPADLVDAVEHVSRRAQHAED